MRIAMETDFKENEEKTTLQYLAEKRIKQLSRLIDLQKQINEIKKTTLDLKEKIDKAEI
jgi:hypothetical protein